MGETSESHIDDDIGKCQKKKNAFPHFQDTSVIFILYYYII